MEKYRRLRQPRDPLGSDEIRVTSSGAVMGYVSYADTLITEQKMKHLTIKASGNAIGQAITIAEQLKRRYKGLHQINKCGNSIVTTVFQPLEEGLDQVTQERTVAFLEIKLSFEPLDERNPGYQPPLDEAARNELKDIPLPGPVRGRGSYRGMRGRGGLRNHNMNMHNSNMNANPMNSGGVNNANINNNAKIGDINETQQRVDNDADMPGESHEFRGRPRGRGGYRGYRGYGNSFRGRGRGVRAN